MPHKDWCGKQCGECESPCALDESMPCSPSCENINADGTRNYNQCHKEKCDAIAQEQGKCPVCGNEELSYGDSFLQDESYVYRWSCKACGADGKEYHKLVFAVHILD